MTSIRIENAIRNAKTDQFFSNAHESNNFCFGLGNTCKSQTVLMLLERLIETTIFSEADQRCIKTNT